MRVLITGIPGWLGNRFLEVLIDGFNKEGPPNDWVIRCLCLSGSDTRSFEPLMQHKKFEIAYGDLTQKHSLKEALSGVNVIFHLAGIIHPKRIKDLYSFNTIGTLNLISGALSAGVKRFIYISSNSVGGINPEHNRLMTERDGPRPFMNYGLSKYYAECIIRSFQETAMIETVILRPCWFYGPYQPKRQTKLFQMIQKGRPLVFGSGLNFRSLSYLDNVIQAMLLAATKKEAIGQTYWIADARAYTTLEIYRTVAEILEVKNFRPIFLPGLSSEFFLALDKVVQGLGRYILEVHVAGEMNKDIACSIEKARNELGYAPQIELREGMRRSIEYCRQKKLL